MVPVLRVQFIPQLLVIWVALGSFQVAVQFVVCLVFVVMMSSVVYPVSHWFCSWYFTVIGVLWFVGGFGVEEGVGVLGLGVGVVGFGVVGFGVGFTLGFGAGAGLAGGGVAPRMGFSAAIFVFSRVFQSSLRIPPVSPLLGLKDQ